MSFHLTPAPICARRLAPCAPVHSPRAVPISCLRPLPPPPVQGVCAPRARQGRQHALPAPGRPGSAGARPALWHPGAAVRALRPLRCAVPAALSMHSMRLTATRLKIGLEIY